MSLYICDCCGYTFQRKPSQIRSKLYFCSLECSGMYRRGSHRVSAKVYKEPYRKVRNDEGKLMLEHRIVAERMLERKLGPNEVVHHLNGNTLDNRPNNLRVMLIGDHISHHSKLPINEAELMEVWSNTKSVSRCAIELGCSKDTIRRRLCTCGIHALKKGSKPIYAYVPASA